MRRRPARWPWLLAWFAMSACGLGCEPRFAVDGDRAHSRVERQVGMGPRIPGTAAHDSARVWIESELMRLGGRVETLRFVDSTLGHPVELANVVGHYGPETGRRIALAAHWDSRPWADSDPDPARRADPVPGANDGASGVAVLLEVAELMSHREPRVGVDLAFLDGEDLGTKQNPDGYCRGSRELARQMTLGRIPAASVVFVFDMIGDRQLDIHPEARAAHDASNMVDLVLDAARSTGASHFKADSRYDLFDDHIPFLDAGIPAVDIIDFDYPAWHTTHDLPDQVSAASLAEVSAVAAWLVYKSPIARP